MSLFRISEEISLSVPSGKHKALELKGACEGQSDVAASSVRLTMKPQPLVQEDMTLVESSHTGGLGEDCVLGALCFGWGSS